MKQPSSVGFTLVLVSGLAAPGLVDLTGGSVLGPFVPRKGDFVTDIVESGASTTKHTFDDESGFASVVEDRGMLRQHDATDLSLVSLYITIARLR